MIDVIYETRNCPHDRLTAHDQLPFKTFDYSEYKRHEIGNNIDPDNNLFNEIIMDCEYYTEDQFRTRMKQQRVLTLLHLNSRSLLHEFGKIKDDLKQFDKRFNIIAITETWLHDSKEAEVELEGYEMICVNRSNQRGGGVALYVETNIKYKVKHEMTTTIKDVMECLTVE